MKAWILETAWLVWRRQQCRSSRASASLQFATWCQRRWLLARKTWREDSAGNHEASTVLLLQALVIECLIHFMFERPVTFFPSKRLKRFQWTHFRRSCSIYYYKSLCEMLFHSNFPIPCRAFLQILGRPDLGSIFSFQLQGWEWRLMAWCFVQRVPTRRFAAKVDSWYWCCWSKPGWWVLTGWLQSLIAEWVGLRWFWSY